MPTAEELILKLDRIREEQSLPCTHMSVYAGFSKDTWTRVYRRRGCDLKTLIQCAEVLGYHLELVRDEE